MGRHAIATGGAEGRAVLGTGQGPTHGCPELPVWPSGTRELPGANVPPRGRLSRGEDGDRHPPARPKRPVALTVGVLSAVLLPLPAPALRVPPGPPVSPPRP